MRVYLIRHGNAADVGGYDRDDDRPLTAEGRRRMKLSAGAWLTSHEPFPERWLVSPLVRAVQTAEICSAALASEGDIDVTRLLIPEARISEVAERIGIEPVDTLALVGHQPLLGGLAAWLLGWKTVPAQLLPGAILAIDLDGEGGGTLAWHMPPTADEGAPPILRPQ